MLDVQGTGKKELRCMSKDIPVASISTLHAVGVGANKIFGTMAKNKWYIWKCWVY